MDREQALLQQKLLAAIRDPGARALVAALVTRSLEAMEGLRTIDETIYKFYLESGEDLGHMFNACAVLQALTAQALAGARKLEAYLQQHGDEGQQPPPADEADLDLDFDLFGESPAVEAEQAIAFKDADISEALDVLAPPPVRSGPEKLALVRQAAEAVRYGISSQLGEFDRRFALACRRESYGQALRELDDIRNALTDAVFALMSTICEAYLGPVDPSLILPGHRSALARALLVRRGLADLRRKINACNARIQNPEVEETIQEFAYENLVELLEDFVRSEVFEAMRPADRWELGKFQQELRGQPLGRVRLTCEGLARYLDSLVSINQRDVLQQHDRDLAREIVELLEAAAPLLSVSPRVAAQLVRDAFEKADALFGKHDALDALLVGWRANPPDMNVVAQIQAAVDKLAAQVRELS